MSNSRYWGARKPAFDKIVLRNMIAPTQLLNVQRGSHEVALDLSPDQAVPLRSNRKLRVLLQPSTWTFYMFAHNDPRVSSVTSNKQFQTAVRYALDYRSLVRLAGRGAIQAPGLLPSTFLGALPQNKGIERDLARAESALAASGVGDQEVTLEYPRDVTINGVSLASMAEKAQASLQEAGIKVALSGSPIGTFLTRFRSGRMPFGLWAWIPDYPDPADYLVFAPGNLVALRVGWESGSDTAIETLAAKAHAAALTGARKALYQQFQVALNQRGPYFPLIQPTQVVVSTTDLKNTAFNAMYIIDVTRVAPT